MDEFKRRFFKTSVSSSNKDQNNKPGIFYCDDCGEECPSKNVIAGFGFCDKCREASGR